MKMRLGNPLHLDCSDGEVVSVDPRSSGTVFHVDYALNGKRRSLREGETIRFPVRMNPSSHTLLLMQFFFSRESGGRYEITVHGSSGGDVSHYVCRQEPGEQFKTIEYKFEVVQQSENPFGAIGPLEAGA